MLKKPGLLTGLFSVICFGLIMLLKCIHGS
jgi:hypothetical protein